METLFTAAYIFLIWIIHFKFKLFKFNVWMCVIYCALYAAAVLADIILLGQVTPFSSEASVDGTVLQLQPKWSGYVDKVYVQASEPIKKGDPILSMQPEQWDARLKRRKAELPAALYLYKEAVQLSPSGAMPQQELTVRKARIEKLRSQVSIAEYNLKHTVTYAPANGYVPLVFIAPNMYLGLLNKNSIPFICTDSLYIVAKLKQESVQYIKKGDPVEIALAMYPGSILNGKVRRVVWAQGDIQFFATSAMPTTSSFKPSDQFFVVIDVLENEKRPLRFGASGKVVIYTSKSIDLSDVVRRIEIRCESLLNFIYNPFR